MFVVFFARNMSRCRGITIFYSAIFAIVVVFTFLLYLTIVNEITTIGLWIGFMVSFVGGIV